MPGLNHLLYLTLLGAGPRATDAIAAIPPDHPTTPHRATTSTFREVVLLTSYPATVSIRARPGPSPAGDDIVADAGAADTIANTSSGHPTPLHYATISDPFRPALPTSYPATVSIRARPSPSLAGDDIVADAGAAGTIANTSSSHPAPLRYVTLSDPSDPKPPSSCPATVSTRARPSPNLAGDEIVADAGAADTIANTSSSHPAPLRYVTLSDPSDPKPPTSYPATASIRVRPSPSLAGDGMVAHADGSSSFDATVLAISDLLPLPTIDCATNLTRATHATTTPRRCPGRRYTDATHADPAGSNVVVLR